jgi:hypothetical protein
MQALIASMVAKAVQSALSEEKTTNEQGSDDCPL